ncbi:hypothetical protein CEXT_676411 [Caerostris extrusa]|uniref:Uncharacterized protein n=1 Tax=Caerostris extrusa TaxID=172846 RepID=A0AAV4X1Z7_CAEEX|nr:hypothetical protein CEXT_676411 [Caerostris extrusa]
MSQYQIVIHIVDNSELSKTIDNLCIFRSFIRRLGKSSKNRFSSISLQPSLSGRKNIEAQYPSTPSIIYSNRTRVYRDSLLLKDCSSQLSSCDSFHVGLIVNFLARDRVKSLVSGSADHWTVSCNFVAVSFQILGHVLKLLLLGVETSPEINSATIDLNAFGLFNNGTPEND